VTCSTQKRDVVVVMFADSLERLNVLILADSLAAEDASESTPATHHPFNMGRNVTVQSELVGLRWHSH
jgi:hypothetical protein